MLREKNIVEKLARKLNDCQSLGRSWSYRDVMMWFTPLPPFHPCVLEVFFSHFYFVCLFCFVVVIKCKRVSLLFELAFIDNKLGLAVVTTTIWALR